MRSGTSAKYAGEERNTKARGEQRTYQSAQHLARRQPHNLFHRSAIGIV